MYCSKRAHVFDKRFAFETREKAEAVLKELRIEIDMTGTALVYELYDIVGYLSDDDFERLDGDYDYFWYDLRKSFVTYTSDGYRLCLPKPIKSGKRIAA